MIKKVLIANRGEIAVRIIRACKEMRIKTVAVYSKVDKNSLHVMLADESYCIGGAKSKDSYLNMNNILSAACLSGCDAIHPGYGFLSENAAFARAVIRCGLIFIGPNPDIIEQMGNKSFARKTMIKAGLPVIPGSDVLNNIEEAKKFAKKIKYPVLLKASNGGGGKGMRVVLKEAELEDAYNICKAEALANFGDDEIYMEKLLIDPKHIEVQVVCDQHGNVVHLFERDCSIQRNKQKLIEEAPCTSISKELKESMYEAALSACKFVNYDSVGTIEFLVKDNDFYFMEMNTRVQVEHGVTEMVTDIDIIKTQISIAMHEPLNFKQEDVVINSHCIECRINAEDVDAGFKPTPGKITEIFLPGGKGVRIDGSIYAHYDVSPFYDSMLLKLIVFAPTRLECIRKLRVALEELIIDGVKTNVDYHYMISYIKSFISGNYNIGFVEKLAKETDGFDKIISESKENSK
ncbi:MAG: acetyl-CoA carboxylase biotin carboxylase subunit [bacterium]